ncbi:MAG: hypothetical protein JW843_02940 [Candidatus Aminicenantes bacterium]|nr:hypothetical protein [Candidatus Aminicenantes bacterium]
MDRPDKTNFGRNFLLGIAGGENAEETGFLIEGVENGKIPFGIDGLSLETLRLEFTPFIRILDHGRAV